MIALTIGEHVAEKIASHMPKHALAVAFVLVLRELAVETKTKIDNQVVDIVAEALGVTQADEDKATQPSGHVVD